MQNVILHLAFITTIFEHLGHTGNTTHARAERGANFRRVHVLVELIWISDTRAIEGLGSACKSPESATIGLSNDIFGNAIAPSVPASRNLPGDGTAEFESFRNKDTSAFLKLGKPLTVFSSPDIAFFTVLELELLGFGFGNLYGFKVVNKLNLLVENLFVGIVATE